MDTERHERSRTRSADGLRQRTHLEGDRARPPDEAEGAEVDDEREEARGEDEAERADAVVRRRRLGEADEEADEVDGETDDGQGQEAGLRSCSQIRSADMKVSLACGSSCHEDKQCASINRTVQKAAQSKPKWP